MAMIVAGFTAARPRIYARHGISSAREARMREIETRLRSGMTRNVSRRPAGDIVKSITSFALYGFPESHAASFALIVRSAYLKCAIWPVHRRDTQQSAMASTRPHLVKRRAASRTAL